MMVRSLCIISRRSLIPRHSSQIMNENATNIIYLALRARTYDTLQIDSRGNPIRTCIVYKSMTNAIITIAPKTCVIYLA